MCFFHHLTQGIHSFMVYNYKLIKHVCKYWPSIHLKNWTNLPYNLLDLLITSKKYSAHKETHKPYQGDRFFPEDGVLVILSIYQDYILDKQLSESHILSFFLLSINIARDLKGQITPKKLIFSDSFLTLYGMLYF